MVGYGKWSRKKRKRRKMGKKRKEKKKEKKVPEWGKMEAPGKASNIPYQPFTNP